MQMAVNIHDCPFFLIKPYRYWQNAPKLHAKMQYSSGPMPSSALLHGVLIFRVSVGDLALLARIVSASQNPRLHSTLR